MAQAIDNISNSNPTKLAGRNEDYFADVHEDGSIFSKANSYQSIFGLLTNSNFLKLANYDQIIPSVNGDTITMQYYESSALIAVAELRFVSYLDWDLTLRVYLNNDNGDILQDDNDVPILLE